MAKPRVKIPLLVFMSEIKNDLSLKKSNFLFLFCLKIAINWFILMRQPSGRRHNFFPSRFASDLMLSAYLLGMFLVAKIARNYGLTKQISRNLHRYNAYSRLRRPDVTCFHNVNLARLVTSLTSL